MANELTINTTLKFVKNGLIIPVGKTTQVTVSGDDFNYDTQVIAHTAHSALALNAVGTEGFCWIRNIDATNFVYVGIDVAASFHDFAKLKPGEESIFRIGTTPVYAKADTASVRVAYLIIED